MTTNPTITVIVSMAIPTTIALGINKMHEIINRTPIILNDGVCFNSITYADIFCVGLLGALFGLFLASLIIIFNDWINMV